MKTCCRLFLLVTTVPVLCQAFAAKRPNFLDGVMTEFYKKNPPSSVPVGDAVLKQLNLTSSVEPQRFYARPQQWPALLTASMPAVFRLGSGVFADGYKVSISPKDSSKYSIATLGKYQITETSQPGRRSQPEPIVLYEFETCPFCRKVREAVSILSLDVTYRPCPKNGRKFRPEIKSSYDSATFPFLRDPNTGVAMFESDDIVAYLFKTYGNGVVPWTLSSPLVFLTAGLGLLFRGLSGGTYQPSNPPPQPLVFWGYEGSPFCKVVREKLCELEIEFTQVSCPRGSPNRQVLLEETGRFQVPYIVDPNTGVSMFESEAIVEYLQKQYGVEPSPVKYI